MKEILKEKSYAFALRTRNNVDALNAVVTVEVAKKDYAEKVEKVLADYRKNAAPST